jgi:hypothetical protein
LDGINCFLLTDLSKIRNDLKSVKQVLLDGERVSFLNESTVPGFYLSSLVPIIIMLAVNICTNTRLEWHVCFGIVGVLNKLTADIIQNEK